MKVRSEFNMAGFTRLCRELEAGAQEAAHEAALDYGRIFTKAAIDWTPPSGGGRNGARVQGAEAKNRQETRIRWDIMGSEFAKPRYYRSRGQLMTYDDGAHHLSPFMLARPKDPVLIVDPRTHLKRFGMKRGRKGMKLDWHGPRAWTTKQALNAEYKRRLARVGRMAAGWMAGAVLSGRKTGIPAWVKRHGTGGGRARLVNRRGKWEIIITNSTAYHPNMNFIINQLLDVVVKAKIRKRDEKVKSWLLKKAQRTMRG